MNLDTTESEQTFREELRHFLSTRLEPNMRDASNFEDRLAADRTLAAGGYLGYSWPQEYGGGGGDPILATILDEERGEAGVPAAVSPSRFGINLLGPTLIAHGTQEQKERFLPKILAAEVSWCQGFSEPEAGSDLANIQTRGEIEGDSLIINGSKIWTTQGPEADWCFALVRTGPREDRHRNLTFVLIDMHQPGVDIQPLVQLTGALDFSQIFFDNVKVPLENIVGEVNAGWRVAMTTLSAERSFGQLSRYGTYQRLLRRIAAMISDHRVEDHRITEEFGIVAADLTGIRNLSYKIASMSNAGEDIGALPSVTKLWWSRTYQRLVDLGHDLSRRTGTDLDFWAPRWFEARGVSIYAGSSQIQLNIISERILGLPR